MKLNSIKAKLTTLASILMAWAGIAASESTVSLHPNVEAGLNRSHSGLKSVQRKDGGVHQHLGGGFKHAVFRRMNAAGQYETFCTADKEEALAFLRGDLKGKAEPAVAPAMVVHSVKEEE